MFAVLFRHSFFTLTLMIASMVAVRVVDAQEPQTDPAKIEFFEKHIRPLLTDHCYECHAGEENNGGLLVDSRQALLTGGDSGASLVPGDPDRSLIVEAVRYKNQDLQMPPDGKLSDTEIALLEKWVRDGAADTRVATSSAPQPTGMTIEDGRKFWSMQPVANPAVPEIPKSNWVQTPIDSFVLQKLQAAGIEPAPPADRATLIRRVSFDLIGLPPTPDEVENFVNDSSPNAYSDLIERLLASPRYGERWGRHWLDVARYADSNGLDENLAFGNAWRYRDYVIESFNRDKPFDRFLIEQIAGDLLPNANRETKTATGFLALGAKVLAEPDREKLVMDTIDEQLDTVGKAFMGMTMGCVRCHDHKFDPLKQTDYYALAAIFKSSQTFGDTKTGAIKHWHEFSFASNDELEEIKKIDKEIAAKKKLATNFKNESLTALRTKARENATEYLVAATKIGPDAPLTLVDEIASDQGLHPRVLHHCRLHLHYKRDDAFFGHWERRKDNPAEVETFFREIFQRSEKALAEAKKEKPATKTLSDPELELARAALYDTTGFLAVPPKPEFAFDAATLQEYYRLMEEARQFESQARDMYAAMGVRDGEVLDALPIHIRGSHTNLGDPVGREFPEVMRTSLVRPIFPSGQSGRLQFANWMANTQHPLTARVYVNRVWRWHFGRGIVGTTENFGNLGDRPSHPELLDYLAYSFMQTGWSTKDLHRLILSSRVYQMSSSTSETAKRLDPENRLFSRFNIQRLEAEQIRDSLLAVSGRLDESIGGKMVPLRNRQFVFNHTSVDHTKYDSLRRAVYLPVIRNNVYPLFEQFDFPDPTMPTGSRSSTTVAPQALLMMNAAIVMDSANVLAAEILGAGADDSARVQTLYKRAFGRTATTRETERALTFTENIALQSLSTNSKSETKHRAWTLLCQSLFASNEFIYLR